MTSGGKQAERNLEYHYQGLSRRFGIWAVAELLTILVGVLVGPSSIAMAASTKLGRYNAPELAWAFLEEVVLIAVIVLVARRFRHHRATHHVHPH